jgi:hypothetical protein
MKNSIKFCILSAFLGITMMSFASTQNILSSKTQKANMVNTSQCVVIDGFIYCPH